MKREESAKHNGGTGMSWLARLAVRYARFWWQLWPFEWGRGFPAVRIMVRASHRGLMQPFWFEFKPGLWMKMDVRDVIQRRILLSNEWDPHCTKFLIDNLRPGMVFLDIGANAGFYTLVAAQLVGSGRVVAVEPSPSLIEHLRRNVERSGLSNVTAVEAACSARNGTGILYLSEFPNLGMSSLSRENARSDRCLRVNCVTADQLCEKENLSRLDVVKIDVEGAEPEVLAGMANILSKMRPRIVIELKADRLKAFSVTVEDVVALLRQHGYHASSMDDQANYIFVPSVKGGSYDLRL